MDITIQLTMEFKVYSIQRRIEDLNQQIGFNVNSIQGQIQLLNQHI